MHPCMVRAGILRCPLAIGVILVFPAVAPHMCFLHGLFLEWKCARCGHPSMLVAAALAPLSMRALTASLVGESWEIMKLDLS